MLTINVIPKTNKNLEMNCFAFMMDILGRAKFENIGNRSPSRRVLEERLAKANVRLHLRSRACVGLLPFLLHFIFKERNYFCLNYPFSIFKSYEGTRVCFCFLQINRQSHKSPETISDKKMKGIFLSMA